MEGLVAPEVSKESIGDAEVPTGPIRSWRKKYRKLRQRFARVMNESNTLTKDDDRAYALARRLQEENEQLLEMLFEMDANWKIQKNRIDLSLIDRSSSDSAKLTTGASPESDDTFLTNLLDMSHKKYDINDISDDLIHESASNYMDVLYMQEYFASVDDQLKPGLEENGNWEDDEDVLADPDRISRPPPSRVVASEKDLLLRNSDSVISWLRRNHPETFIQDKDNEKDKTEPKKRGGGKRASMPVPKKEPDEVEEDVELLPELPPPEKPTKGKRNKEDEPYRPKGGSSSKNSKRKRAEDGDTPAKAGARGKKVKA